MVPQVQEEVFQDIRRHRSHYENELLATALDKDVTTEAVLNNIRKSGSWVGQEFCHAYGKIHGVKIQIFTAYGRIDCGMLESKDVLRIFFSNSHYESVLSGFDMTGERSIKSRSSTLAKKRKLMEQQPPPLDDRKLKEELQDALDLATTRQTKLMLMERRLMESESRVLFLEEKLKTRDKEKDERIKNLTEALKIMEDKVKQLELR